MNRIPRVPSVLRFPIAAAVILASVLIPPVTGLSAEEVATIPPPGAGSQVAGDAQTVLSVLDFADNTGDPEWAWLSAGLSDMLITDLGRTGLPVVDRDDLNAVLEEQTLALSGITDDEAAAIGRILSADVLLSGAYAVSSGILRIDARIVDVGTGGVIGTAAAQGRAETVFLLETALAEEVCGVMGIEPPETAEGRGSGAGTDSLPAARAYYEGLALQESGDVEAARLRFEDAADLDPLYARPRYSLEESWQLLKDFRRLRRQREVNALWFKADALIRRLADRPFVSDSDILIAATAAGSPTTGPQSPFETDPSMGSCPTPAVCLWNLQIAYWEIGTKSAEYFGDEATKEASLRKMIVLARRAEEAWPDDEWLPEILYWEILAHRWLNEWPETAAGCERLFIEWPDFRMGWALEEMYEEALEHLGK
jgi:TolB-like protein